MAPKIPFRTRFRYWKKWRKVSLNGLFHDLLVLVGLIHSPSFLSYTSLHGESDFTSKKKEMIVDEGCVVCREIKKSRSPTSAGETLSFAYLYPSGGLFYVKQDSEKRAVLVFPHDGIEDRVVLNYCFACGRRLGR